LINEAVKLTTSKLFYKLSTVSLLVIGSVIKHCEIFTISKQSSYDEYTYHCDDATFNHQFTLSYSEVCVTEHDKTNRLQATMQQKQFTRHRKTTRYSAFI